LRLCLPTGKTPIPAYGAFAAARGRLDAATVFLLDEFVLPDGHPARCDVMLQTGLLDLLQAPPRTLHRLDVAGDLAAECERYAALVADGGLDLTLLGLGGNGHIGLNEPGTSSDSPTRVVDLHPQTVQHAAQYGGVAAPQHGVTLGMAAILASQEIWLLVTGRHKAEILSRAVTGPMGSDVPATFLRNHPNVWVLTDEDAATRLPSSE
jgi:glucosamine-6-phosphate deaminase